jgi:hypothetical protein
MVTILKIPLMIIYVGTNQLVERIMYGGVIHPHHSNTYIY